MRLVRGREVRDVWILAARNDEGWNRPRAVGVLVRVCQALAFAHERGRFHQHVGAVDRCGAAPRSETPGRGFQGVIEIADGSVR